MLQHHENKGNYILESSKLGNDWIEIILKPNYVRVRRKVEQKPENSVEIQLLTEIVFEAQYPLLPIDRLVRL
jgi:hypothetical protein